MDKGFVCPNWALGIWTRTECTVEATTDNGVYVVLDHNIQIVVFRGTKLECKSFLND